MSIDKNQVKKVAKLSRISLDDKNLDSLSNDLASILKFVEQLNKLNTNKIEPLSSIINKTLEPRKDKVIDGKIKEEVLKNSPDKNEDFFIVPKVIE
ncbi:MAG: aspartyl/glutamyl-tRNA(Asn/Gln) amidotransferase subunit C [Candidatus Pelagibacter sp. TMED196]|nr:MAG: aspartyl/glutamyl-tRNA(Asn/Gln) amidotransferase subunit C [Candidatus Pelagibacter sp. TMED196]|tara:strand:+ start:4 stop:291 length:288 start_codon:yes stop_codon:yes gene_type:complete